ncbi:MAG: alpha/beta hydrolase-fold protein [Opitutus sp.]
MKLKMYLGSALVAFALSAVPDIDAAEIKHGSVVTEHLESSVLRENRTGLDPNRTVMVYLPPGYAESGKAYPVVYYFHSLNGSAEKVFQNGNLVRLLERGFATGVVKEFILVAADYSSPVLGSLYENSPVSGRWLDFTVGELVPFIDGHFRTLRQRDSRGLAGDFMGGRGALKLAMTHAETFGSVYALHPVATGAGALPWGSIDIDWKKVHQAKTAADLNGPGREKIFVSISQAFLPNANRPPFFCDFPVEFDGTTAKPVPDNLRKAQKAFHLDETLDESAANLRSLRGLAFDWGRFDSTQAHVDSNREFSRKLQDLGIEHEAEEFRGSPWDRYWTENGRFYTRVLPFFQRTLVFE